jgi:hypothetical protein
MTIDAVSARRAAAALGARVRGAVAAALLAAACGPRPAPLAPAGAFVPVSAGEFLAAVARTAPGTSALLAIRWTYDDGMTPMSGRGAVRLAPPDSLRLDVSLGILGRATLVLAGDSAWSQPGNLVRQVVPNRPLLWAMFGKVVPPENVAGVELNQAADRRIYRVTSAGGMVTLLELKGDTLLTATQSRGERPIGRLDLTRDPAGQIVRAEAVDLEHSERFVVDVNRRESGGSFPSEIWRRP